MGILTQGLSIKDELNNQEIAYILALISQSRFEGKDVFVVAEIANKLNKKINLNEVGDK